MRRYTKFAAKLTAWEYRSLSRRSFLQSSWPDVTSNVTWSKTSADWRQAEPCREQCVRAGCYKTMQQRSDNSRHSSCVCMHGTSQQRIVGRNEVNSPKRNRFLAYTRRTKLWIVKL